MNPHTEDLTEDLQRARTTGVLVTTAPIGHDVYRRWSAECDAAHRAEIRVRLMPQTAYVFADLFETGRELDDEGAASIVQIAPKTGWVKGFAFKGVTTAEFRVPRSRLAEVERVLGRIARGEGTRPFSTTAKPPAGGR